MAKIFNDPIHGHIELHPLCVKIIDTPQFQRLRFIKQLGGCYYVFPGASHNRFEHSLGVCHLAGQLARVLQDQEELKISDEDVLCVQIAGLCHDLGHGPFSHLFDRHFIPQITKKGKDKEGGWKHEDASVMMFDHLVEVNNLKPEFTHHKLEEVDRIFIKEMINGQLQPKQNDHQGKSEQGLQERIKGKSFLYDIVSNKRNGIDVDKWDYFARDCHMLGVKNNFDHNRLMKFSRVIGEEDDRQICFRDKEAFNLYEMFHTRIALHTRALQHKVTKVIEDMITEAMVMANPHIKIPGTNGREWAMSECVNDMVAYTNLTDEILRQILLSKGDALKPSKIIINDILRRKLYKFVGESRPISARYIEKEEMGKTKCGLMKYLALKAGLTEKDIHIHVVTLDYGMKNRNPIQNVRFYKKADPETPIRVPKHQVSQMLPKKFAEQIIRVFLKYPAADKDSKKQDASTHFEAWCKANKWSHQKVTAKRKQRSNESEHASRSKIPRKQ